MGAVVQEVLKQASGELRWGQGWGTGTTSNRGREWRRAEPVCGEMEQLPLGLQNLLSLLSSIVCSLLPSPLSFGFCFYLSISCYLFLLSFSLFPCHSPSLSLFLRLSFVPPISVPLSMSLFPSFCLFLCVSASISLWSGSFSVSGSLNLSLFMAGRGVPCTWLRVYEVPTGYLRKRGYEGGEASSGSGG